MLCAFIIIFHKCLTVGQRFKHIYCDSSQRIRRVSHLKSTPDDSPNGAKDHDDDNDDDDVDGVAVVL